MDKMISSEELLEITNAGGKFRIEKKEVEKGPVEIEGFKDIIAQLARIAKSNEDIAAKQSEKLTQVPENLVKASGQQKVNMNPIINMVRELKELAKPKEVERPAYEFIIQRDNRGLMKSVEAVPMNTGLM